MPTFILLWALLTGSLEDPSRLIKICHIPRCAIPPENPPDSGVVPLIEPCPRDPRERPRIETIWVTKKELPGHLDHGDFLGECREDP